MPDDLAPRLCWTAPHDRNPAMNQLAKIEIPVEPQTAAALTEAEIEAELAAYNAERRA